MRVSPRAPEQLERGAEDHAKHRAQGSGRRASTLRDRYPQLNRAGGVKPEDYNVYIEPQLQRKGVRRHRKSLFMRPQQNH